MSQEGKEIRPVQVLMPADLHHRLQRMSQANDRSVSAETRRAIEDRLRDFEAEDSPVPAGTSGEVA
jgi:predicted transcriptional regulator